MIMPIERLADWEQRLARQDACWQCEILDRPLVCMSLWEPNPDYPAPKPKQWASHREQWMDTDYIVESALYGVMNTVYLGDALPIFNPNLGPEILSAFYGCEMEFSEGTSWSVPNLHDWSQFGKLQVSEDNFYWKKLAEITDAALEAGKGKFYTGLTDFHAGGDLLASLRDPLQFNFDMIDAYDTVKACVPEVTKTYFRVFDWWYNKLAAAGQACTCWAGVVSGKKYYVPSNDFSCMISKAMFDDLFLPGIIAECQHMEANVYHLDGPDALRHLDSLLSIPELNMIQWVYGAGNGRTTDWLPVHQKCQAAGKGVQVWIELDELDTLMANLHPQGVWLSIYGVPDRDTADAVLKKVANWR